jgi:hypothetical protein
VTHVTGGSRFSRMSRTRSSTAKQWRRHRSRLRRTCEMAE